MAFSTVTGGALDNDQLNTIFAAAYESAHEAVLNCLVAAEPAERLDGTLQDAFPIERVREIVQARPS
jgi:L-aminopeptidase/D-esterase-like protein